MTFLKKNFFLLIFLFFWGISKALTISPDSIYWENIVSVNFYHSGSLVSDPMIELNSDDELILEFDILGTNDPYLHYALIHCDHNWQKSELSQMEYLESFAEAAIYDVAYSMNTNQAYVNYSISLPSSEVRPTRSGNYILIIYEDDIENPVLTRKLYVYENLVSVDAYFSKATKFEDIMTRQELNFAIHHPSYRISNSSKLNVVIKQNGREDNKIVNPKPVSILSSSISYEGGGNIVFDGGGEFRSFDIKSLRYKLDGVSHISTQSRNEYVAILHSSHSRRNLAYESKPDINGRYVIKTEDWDDQMQAEYVRVNFHLKTTGPIVGGDIYIFGELTDWKYLPKAKMKEMDKYGEYVCSMVLKQGYYNYHYMFLPHGANIGDVSQIEGNYWETENDYTIFVYYREDGDISDKLISIKKLKSTQRR